MDFVGEDVFVMLFYYFCDCFEFFLFGDCVGWVVWIVEYECLSFCGECFVDLLEVMLLVIVYFDVGYFDYWMFDCR